MFPKWREVNGGNKSPAETMTTSTAQKGAAGPHGGGGGGKCRPDAGRKCG